MRTILTLTIVIATLFAFSCKPTSKPMNSDSSVPRSDVKTHTTNKDEAANQTIIYDMIVSFISKGEGLDYKLVEQIDTTISNFNVQHKTEITPEIIGWGREGEKDYNFILKNLSTPLQKEFIKSIENTVGKSDMAHITFNQASVHKR